MLSIQQMKDRLKQTTYKPGWEMSIYEGFSRGAMFRLVAIVDDSVNKGQKVPLEIYSAIPTPAKTSIEQFDLYINWRLKDIELHEVDEWHQVNGEALYYPHRPFADRDIIEGI